MAQLAEAALNGTEHMVVACDPNPMAYVCHLCECQFEPPSMLKNLLLAFAKHHGAEIAVDRIRPGRQRRAGHRCRVRDDHDCSVFVLQPLKVFLEPFQRGLAPHRVQGAILRARHGHASFRPDKGEEPAEHTLATGKRLYGPDRK